MNTIDFYSGFNSQSDNSNSDQSETSYSNSDKLVLQRAAEILGVSIDHLPIQLHILSTQNLPLSNNTTFGQLFEPTPGSAISNSILPCDSNFDDIPWTEDAGLEPNLSWQRTSIAYSPPAISTRPILEPLPYLGEFSQEQVRKHDDSVDQSICLSLPYNFTLSCITENFFPTQLSENLTNPINFISESTLDGGAACLNSNGMLFSPQQSTQLLNTLPYGLQPYPEATKSTNFASLATLALEQSCFPSSSTSGAWTDGSQVMSNFLTSDSLHGIPSNHPNPSGTVSGATVCDTPLMQSLGSARSLLDKERLASQLIIQRPEKSQNTFQDHKLGAVAFSTTEVFQSFAKPLRPKSNILTGKDRGGSPNIDCLSSKQVRKRRPFQSLEDKQETSQTRERRACIRCRMQRIRCILDREHPDKPCISCQKLQKSIFRLPCLRYKITDSLLCRNGPSSPRFCASLRWWGKTLEDISDWESGHDRVIEISQGHGPSISVKVKMFIPQPEDRLEYRWIPNGIARPYGFANIEQPGTVRLAMPPYAIANIREAATAFRKYIDGNVLTYLNLVVNESEPISFKILHMAYRYSRKYSVNILQDCLRFWTACRLTEGRWTICGRDTLGVVISNNPDSPFCGKAPLTPMMLFQGDQILLNMVIKPLRKSLLAQLQKLVLANKPSNWFTIFLCAFLLLQNYELCCAHDIRFSALQNLKTRWSNQALIDGYQSGANTIIAHFRYCNKGYYPFNLDWRSFKDILFAELDQESAEFLASLSELVRGNAQRFKEMENSDNFEESLHFASQLFIE